MKNTSKFIIIGALVAISFNAFSRIANATPVSLRCSGVFQGTSNVYGKSSYEKTFFVQILGDGSFLFSGDQKIEPLTGVVVETSRSYTLKFVDDRLTLGAPLYVIDRITGIFTASYFYSDNNGNYDNLEAEGSCEIDNSFQKF